MSKESRHGEVIDVEKDGVTKRFRIVEIPVDPPNTIRRILVPVETTEEDIPVGARLLDERETEGHLARASRPPNILVGDTVMRALANGETPTDKHGIRGTVDAKLKGNRWRIRFENGEIEKMEAKDLLKVY